MVNLNKLIKALVAKYKNEYEGEEHHICEYLTSEEAEQLKAAANHCEVASLHKKLKKFSSNVPSIEEYKYSVSASSVEELKYNLAVDVLDWSMGA